MTLRLTRARAVGLDTRRRLFWGAAPLSLLAMTDGAPAPVELTQVSRGWHARQAGDKWLVDIAEGRDVTAERLARVQRLRWQDIEVEVANRIEPADRSSRIWRLECVVARRTGEQW